MLYYRHHEHRDRTDRLGTYPFHHLDSSSDGSSSRLDACKISGLSGAGFQHVTGAFTPDNAAFSNRHLRGGSLCDLLEDYGGVLSEAEAKLVGRCMLRGLRDMHAGGYGQLM